jgi:hypothetical protein
MAAVDGANAMLRCGEGRRTQVDVGEGDWEVGRRHTAISVWVDLEDGRQFTSYVTSYHPDIFTFVKVVIGRRDAGIFYAESCMFFGVEPGGLTKRVWWGTRQQTLEAVFCEEEDPLFRVDVTACRDMSTSEGIAFARASLHVASCDAESDRRGDVQEVLRHLSAAHCQ